MNFLPFPVTDGQVVLGNLRLAPPGDASRVVLGIRPEDLEPVAEPDGFPFTVQVVEPLGSHTLLTGQAGDSAIRVMAASDLRPASGSVLHLRPHPQRVSWFDAESNAALEHSA